MPTTAPARKSGQRRSAASRSSSSRRDDEAPIIPILARKVREVEAEGPARQAGPHQPHQVPGHRLPRARGARQVKADTDLTDAARAEQLKRLDGVATILAKTAARDTSLIQLLEVDQARRRPSPSACAGTGCWSRAPNSRPTSSSSPTSRWQPRAGRPRPRSPRIR